MVVGRTLRVITVLLAYLVWASSAAAAPEQDTSLTPQDVEQVLEALEDPERREEIIKALRALSAVSPREPVKERESVRTAAAELVAQVAQNARRASKSANKLVDSVSDVPGALGDWADKLALPDYRQRWLTIAWRLFAVLGSGFAFAALVGWLVRRISKRRTTAKHPSVAQRVGSLSMRFLFDLTPIAALGILSYSVLTIVDPRQETRLVAVALINASLFSRLALAIATFLLSPRATELRLWPIADESAKYIYRWTKRLTAISVYGYFGLQAGFLLGMEPDVYATLLRGLGLVVLLMLLALITQNRRQVAAAISAEPAADVDEPASVSSFRRGLARVWHLLAGAYLILIYGIWALRIEDGSIYLLRATVLSFAALAVGNVFAHAINQYFGKGLQLSDELRQQHLGLEGRLNRYFPALRKLTKGFLVIGVALVVGYAWGIDTLAWVTEGSGKVFFAAALHILLILGIAFFSWEFASGAIESYLAETDSSGRVRIRSARTKTLLTVARNALLVVLSVVTWLMVLSELGVNIAPLLAGAGVVGLAVGFGAQRLVQDVINGAFILFQDLMSVGDVVKLGDKAGVVEAVSIRTVRLRDLAGVVHTIPFSAIEAVSNLTREFSYHVFELGIAYREDVDQVIALIKVVGEELLQDLESGPLILEPLEMLGLDKFGDSAIVIKGRIKTQPGKQWQVGRAFNRLIKQRFDEHKIEIPFPHQTIYFGQDRDGSAPPAYLQLEGMLEASQLRTRPAPADD